MKSMTGFGKKQCNLNGKSYTIEIKTLNSKVIDANVKLPNSLKEHELSIRSQLNRLERGKIDFFVTEDAGSDKSLQLNSEAVKSRYNDLKALSESLGEPVDTTALLSVILQQSDVWNSREEELLDEEGRQTLARAVDEALDGVDATRSHEGMILKADFEKHLDKIAECLSQIPAYETERITIAKERMRNYLNDAAIKEVDQNRFEQELIYYLEKLDITEEKVRLAKHIDYFRDVMEHEEGSGKKLNFIAQEMGREINTTGSKANHVEIQRLVVMMKDELEKIKEQLGNIL